jgi:hypothetical protein
MVSTEAADDCIRIGPTHAVTNALTSDVAPADVGP